jgi:hypothetical protein
LELIQSEGYWGAILISIIIPVALVIISVALFLLVEHYLPEKIQRPLKRIGGLLLSKMLKTLEYFMWFITGMVAIVFLVGTWAILTVVAIAAHTVIVLAWIAIKLVVLPYESLIYLTEKWKIRSTIVLFGIILSVIGQILQQLE